MSIVPDFCVLHFIYVLIDPRDNQIRYVGQTVNPKKREYDHRYLHKDADQTNYKVYWIKNLKNQGLNIIFRVIEITSKEQINEREIFWIEYYKNLGCKLTNTTLGGDGSLGVPQSKKAFEIHSKRMKEMWEGGFKWTEEQLKKRSETRMGVPIHGASTREVMAKKKQKLTDKQVLEIYHLAWMGEDYYKIAEKYNTQISTISAIKHNKRFQHIPKQLYLPLFEKAQTKNSCKRK